jgi:hypothetical protein
MLFCVYVTTFLFSILITCVTFLFATESLNPKLSKNGQIIYLMSNYKIVTTVVFKNPFLRFKLPVSRN